MKKDLIAIIEPNGSYALDWADAETAAPQICRDIFKHYETSPEKALFFLGFQTTDNAFSPPLRFLRDIAALFIRELTHTPGLEELRNKITVLYNEELATNILNAAPFMLGSEHLSPHWLKIVWKNLLAVFSKEIAAFAGTVAEYFAKNTEIHLAGRVYFHLVENKAHDAPFAFLATYSTHISQAGKAKHLPLKQALIEYGEDSKKLMELLITVNKASEKSAFVAALLESKEIFYPLKLSAAEAHTILSEIPLYEEAGILCRIPNWWKAKSDSLKVTVKVGEKNPASLTFNALVDFQVELSLGGEKLTLAEAQRLLAESEGLALIKNKWVEIDHHKLQETLAAYEQAQSLCQNGEIDLFSAMRLQLNAEKTLPVASDSHRLEIKNGVWLQTVLSNLARPDTLPQIDCGNNFRAELRAYQNHGLNWLNYMRTLGLGSCLADDMGLGKTVQVIALLNYLRSTNLAVKTLIVIPASLIGNWINELKRFSPQLAYFVIHPSENLNLDKASAVLLNSNKVFITTYSLLTKYEWLADTVWDCLILDEAQAIKNPHTKQTRAVKHLQAKQRIVMTGTPIENRLADLWSLFDFLNPGLLGTTKEFTDFTKGLQVHPAGFAKLKKIVSPFILRRLKTDRSIIADLPQKIEMKTYASLSKKQAALYARLVEELKCSLEMTEGIQRKGLVLGAILKFKQICNHPDQYLGQKLYLDSESGKFERLKEICETILEKRERVLVFTQFKEITSALADYLENVFGSKGLILHGGVAVKKRQEIVEMFQGHKYVPFLVLSLKAGGVGLNLTSANHVIHFDRWWNPAVENQATDRAFRIGQQKNVIIHKFITKGTIEEKIDLMLEDKIKLARDILPDSQKKWLTEMNNKELLDLFALSV
ncbi:DEAD/DEAH box helicase [Candidatus Saganbacteria bacterium]|nr:DEAD/DEAH box helicase [Candidatus Saganbacteria bacterium]